MTTIVIATLVITAALRELAPRIDGPWIVLVVACVVGAASSFVAMGGVELLRSLAPGVSVQSGEVHIVDLEPKP